jgi:hypothetical protein
LATVDAHAVGLQNPQTKPKEEDPVPIGSRSREVVTLVENEIAPGQFGSFLTPQINNRGDIAFVGRYPVAGVTNGFGQAIFVRSADGKWTGVRDVDPAKNIQETGFAFSLFDLNEQGDLTVTASFGKKASSAH